MGGITEVGSAGGWNQELRRAVTALKSAYPGSLSYESLKAIVADAVNVPKPVEDLWKLWWSQRDLNPCLSLERADEDEENQQDK